MLEANTAENIANFFFKQNLSETLSALKIKHRTKEKNLFLTLLTLEVFVEYFNMNHLPEIDFFFIKILTIINCRDYHLVELIRSTKNSEM